MKRCSILCAALLLMASLAMAAPPARSGTSSREPVEITADRLEADDAAKTLVFIGHAVAKQADVTLYGDRLTIYYTAKGAAPDGAKGGDVDRILAEGGVRIIQGTRVATGGRGEYFRNEDRLVLTGSPKVVDGANSVQGHEIVLFFKENRSVVKGGQDGRVNAVFQPKQEVAR